jgi:hypothetical protein
MSEEIQKVDEAIIDSNPPKEIEVPTVPAEPEVDYKTKFSESSKEALRLLEESKAKDAEIERLRQQAEQGASYSNDTDTLYPGFETLPEDEQRNLIAYTNSIKDKVKQEVYNDPAIAYAKQSYNETKWSQAFEEVATQYPDIKGDAEFKTKYFKADNVPTNIKEILTDLAKIHLFDKAKDIGAAQALEQANRIDIERASGGTTTPTATRTLEDWQKLAATNPAEFAKNSKQFNEDLQSGKLK